VRTWKVSKNAGRKKLAEIAQGSVKSPNLSGVRAAMRIHAAPWNSLARALPFYELGAPWK
jgi:hypothetical protein